MEKLERIGFFEDGIGVSRPPNDEEIMEKVNEIVDWINSKKDQLL